MTRGMNAIRKSLHERLTARGFHRNEIDLFIKDVGRLVNTSREFNLATIKGRLELLGWQIDNVDYWTITLIQACCQEA